MAREDLAEGFEHPAIGGPPEMDRDFAGEALADAVERRDLRREHPHRFVVALQFASHEHQCSRLDQGNGALERLGKRDHFDAALGVLQREHGHPVALPRLELAHGGHDAADRRVGLDRLRPAGAPAIVARRCRLRRSQIANRLRAQILERRRVAIDRMTAPIQSERLLLEPELLGLGPGRRVRQRKGLEAVRSWSHVAVALRGQINRAEQLRLALVAIALEPRAMVARRVDGGEQPRPKARRLQRFVRGAFRERIERASLDQAFEHALVHQAQIEILAHRCERRDSPALPAHVEQRLDGAVAHVLDRGQTEPDPCTGIDGEAPLARVDVGRQHRDSPVATLAKIERQLVGVL